MKTVLFLACLLARVGLALYAPLGLLRAAAVVLAIAWAYLYATGGRPFPPESLGDPLWWNGLRPVHAALFTCFALTGDRRFLLFDAGLGAAASLYHYKIK